MRENINKVSERGAKIDDLEGRTGVFPTNNK